MRIILLLIKYTVAILIGGTVIALVTREVLLFWGTQQVKIAENKMEVQGGAKLKEMYDNQCKTKGSGRAGMSAQSVQLRFTSDTEYQVEVVCTFFSNDPIVVQTYKLPPMVKKVSGQAGFTSTSKAVTGGLILEVYGRRTSLMIIDNKYKAVQGSHEIVGAQPEATCGGYGYACCSVETQIGTGSVFSAASDCPTECFSSCRPRPSVLKFTSDPNPDLKTRTVTISKGAPITFYYVIDPGQMAQATTEIQFGDGQKQDFPEQDNNYTYQYQCAEVECRYTAQIVVSDVTGTTSVPTSISSINIVVR